MLASRDDTTVNPQRNTGGLAKRLRAAGVLVEETYYENTDHGTLVAALALPLRALAPVLDSVERLSKPMVCACNPSWHCSRPARLLSEQPVATGHEHRQQRHGEQQQQFDAQAPAHQSGPLRADCGAWPAFSALRQLRKVKVGIIEISPISRNSPTLAWNR